MKPTVLNFSPRAAAVGLGLALALLLGGCASVLQSPAERADALARGAGFVAQPGGRYVRAWLKAPPGKV